MFPFLSPPLACSVSNSSELYTAIASCTSPNSSLKSIFFFFSSRRRHTRFDCDWSSHVCSSDLPSCCELPRRQDLWPAPFRNARSRPQIRLFQPEHVQDCNALLRNSAAARQPADNELSPRQFRLGRAGRCPDCNAPSSSRDFLPASPCTRLLSHGRSRSAATSKTQATAGVFRTRRRGEKVSI